MNPHNLLTQTRKKVLIIVTILFFIFMLWHDIYAAVSTWRDPVGHISVNFIIWRQSFHSTTILAISSIFLVLYFYSFPDKELLYRLFFSIVLSIYTVIFYEFWWHLGSWLTSGYGKPLFWGMYVGAISICILYLHRTYGLLRISNQRLGVFFICMGYFLFMWWMIASSGFYDKYLAFCLGQVPDPHTIFNMYVKVFGMVMWICFFRCGRPVLPGGRVELLRKKMKRWFLPQKWRCTHKMSESQKEAWKHHQEKYGPNGGGTGRNPR